jgi:hypothetical protein
MATNYPITESSDLYTRDFLVKVPYAFPQATPPTERKQTSFLMSFVVSCLSMAGMIIYNLTPIHGIVWDIRTLILILTTGVVSFTLAHIFLTLFFGKK